MRWAPCPAENSGGDGGRPGLRPAPDQAGDLGRLVGAAGELLQGEQATAEAVAEAGGDGGELEREDGVGGTIDGAREGAVGAAGEPHGQVVDGAELQGEQAA